MIPKLPSTFPRNENKRGNPLHQPNRDITLNPRVKINFHLQLSECPHTSESAVAVAVAGLGIVAAAVAEQDIAAQGSVDVVEPEPPFAASEPLAEPGAEQVVLAPSAERRISPPGSAAPASCS